MVGGLLVTQILVTMPTFNTPRELLERSVASILKAGLDKHAAPNAKQLELNLPEHANVRGPDYYH